MSAVKKLDIEILAIWDEDAKVWSAASDDLFGLVFEAKTVDQLIEESKVLTGELLAEQERKMPIYVNFKLVCEKSLQSQQQVNPDRFDVRLPKIQLPELAAA